MGLLSRPAAGGEPVRFALELVAPELGCRVNGIEKRVGVAIQMVATVHPVVPEFSQPGAHVPHEKLPSEFEQGIREV